MTEYWVSQAKYHCKICNCYMADNKMSRQHHENSVRHKINFDKMTKEKKNQRLQDAHAQRELRETLQQIEKAAREAMVADGSSMFASAAPPPPKYGYDLNRKQQVTGETGPVLEEEQNSGFYTIDGKTYLDGKVFQQKLRTGRECEVFVEELDDWYPGIILSRRDIQVPNTNMVLVTFEVQYKITFEDGTEETAQENGVKSDRLRMIANEEQDQEILSAIAIEEKAAIPPPPPPPPAPLDENTGVSLWQTVSVTVVNEDEEYEAHKKAVEEMYNNKKVEEKSGSKGHILEDDAPEYQPKTYKGIIIEDAPVNMSANHLTNEDDEDGKDTIVSFKRRKIDEKTFIKTEENNGDGESKPLFKQMKAKNFRKK